MMATSHFSHSSHKRILSAQPHHPQPLLVVTAWWHTQLPMQPRGLHKNSSPRWLIWRRHKQQPVEAPGSQQCWVHSVWPVGGCQHHHAQARLQAVHLSQQLAQDAIANTGAWSCGTRGNQCGMTVSKTMQPSRAVWQRRNGTLAAQLMRVVDGHVKIASATVHGGRTAVKTSLQ